MSIVNPNPKYTYSLSGDFAGGLNLSAFHDEIVADVLILQPFAGVEEIGDDVNIYFTIALTAPEETELDVLVANHTPPATAKNISQIKRITPTVSTLKNSNFTQLAAFTYAPAQDGNLLKITAIASKNSAITSYDLRLFDSTHKTVIASATFTNDEPEINDLGTISNLPTNVSLMIFQAKRTGGKNNDQIQIEEIALYF